MKTLFDIHNWALLEDKPVAFHTDDTILKMILV